MEERCVRLWSGDAEAEGEAVTGQACKVHTGQKLESCDVSQLTLAGDCPENILLKSNGGEKEKGRLMTSLAREETEEFTRRAP